MNEKPDPLSRSLDRGIRTASRAMGFLVSAGLGGLALWGFLHDSSPIHDSHIISVLLLILAAGTGLFFWYWGPPPQESAKPGWRRIWEACMATGSFLFITAIASTFGREPMPLWLAVAFVVTGFVLFLVALALWNRHASD